MLFPQVKPLRGAEVETPSLFDRCAIVEEALCQCDKVGPPGSDKSWIKGVADMRMFTIRPNNEVVFFFAQLGKLYLALGGSSKHLLGNSEARRLDSSLSFQDYLVERLERLLNDESNEPLETGMDLYAPPDFDELERHLSVGVAQGPVAWDSVIREFANRRKPLPQRVRFLARRLLTVDKASRRTLLATPLYVSLED